MPTLVVWGDSDAFTREEEATELADGIPGSARSWLPETGHMPNLERPDEFNDALRALGARAYREAA